MSDSDNSDDGNVSSAKKKKPRMRIEPEVDDTVPDEQPEGEEDEILKITSAAGNNDGENVKSDNNPSASVVASALNYEAQELPEIKYECKYKLIIHPS